MWSLPADRRVLLDIFGKESSQHLHRVSSVTNSSLMRYSGNELLLLWGNEPRPAGASSSSGESLPNAIVVRPEDMRDFIAWATTVITGYRPFTAFFKILDRKQAEIALEPREPALGRFENALAGLIIGETLTLSPNQRSLSALSLLPCQSTYSYSFARAFALGYVENGDGADPLAAPMALARRLTRQPARKLGDDVLPAVFKVIAALASDTPVASYPNVPKFIWETCRDLWVHGEVKRSWRFLEDSIGSPSNNASELVASDRYCFGFSACQKRS
jgi:hypothetical protein